ncbi:MAG: hypothetical protein EBV25_05115, partial [Methylophilaceae bacterium]|nr:hypothetical protein [Methylophilaceae bacterium]
ALENLMRAFMNASHYDSAAVFAANYADQHPSLTNVLRAGQLFFEAQTGRLTLPARARARMDRPFGAKNATRVVAASPFTALEDFPF